MEEMDAINKLPVKVLAVYGRCKPKDIFYCTLSFANGGVITSHFLLQFRARVRNVYIYASKVVYFQKNQRRLEFCAS